MRRFIVILTAAAALTGCKISEAESVDPVQIGAVMFRPVHEELIDATADAADVFLFDAYYSAPEADRKDMHDRYFYTSRIFSSGDEWHIVDTDRELIIYTGGKSLSEAGTTWRYRYASTVYYDETDMPSLTSRVDENVLFEKMYCDFKLPYDRGVLKLEPHYLSETRKDGTIGYWIELEVAGAGKCYHREEHYDLENIDYEATDPLRYSSLQQWFIKGELNLTAKILDKDREAKARYEDDGRVWITYRGHSNMYRYRWYY